MNSPPPPDLLYHYTDQGGLVGILQGRKLWASSIHHLNDPNELLSLRIANAECEFRRRKAEEDGNLRRVRLYRAIYGGIEEHFSEDAFVCSFSTEGDLLEQWRAYCPREGGYSIGFRREALTQLEFQAGGAFGTVEYVSSEELTAKVLAALDRIEERVDHEASSGAASARYPHMSDVDAVTCVAADLARETADELTKHLPFEKDARYRRENEWRLFVRPNEGPNAVLLRPGRMNVVPYVEIPFGSLDYPIAKVIVGPTANMERAVRALKAASCSRGCKVVASEVPYIGW